MKGVPPLRGWIRNLLALTSFAIYAGAVLLLQQEHPAAWTIETESGIPAAISYAVYGTPLGSIDANVLAEFYQLGKAPFSPASVSAAVAKTAAGSIPRGPLLETVQDGNGLGWPAFASLAMQLFGPDLSSVTFLLLLLMGASTAAFLLRYQDNRLVFIPLVYWGLTLMLLSPLVTSAPLASQFAIGGIRYFSLLAILPALHLFFEITDTSRRNGLSVRDFALLGLQMLLLALIVLARINAAAFIAPIVGALAWRAWVLRHERPERRRLLYKAGFAALVAVFFIGAMMAINPAYPKSGQTFGTFWHRVLTGITADPAWPYGNLRQVYDCGDAVPGGLSRGMPDQQAHCIWWAWPPNRQRPPAEVIQGVHGGEYENVLRAAFFHILRHYPREVLTLQLRHKPLWIQQTLIDGLRFSLAISPKILALVALQGAVFLAFIVWGAWRREPEVTVRAAIVPTLFAFSLLPLFVHFSHIVKAADSIVLLYMTIALACALLIQRVMHRLVTTPHQPQEP